LGDLSSGGTLQMQLVVLSLPAAGEQQSIFDIRANENDPDLDNNTVEVMTQVE